MPEERKSLLVGREFPARESVAIEVMSALELLLDVAYHDGTDRDLAVAAEAWSLAGYHDGSIMISHASRQETLRRVTKARKGRPRRLLRADARGALYAVTVLAEQMLLDGILTRERTNNRWRERGGHDWTDYA